MLLVFFLPPVVRRQVKVIELCDLKKEYQLIDARLKIANHDPDSVYTSSETRSSVFCSPEPTNHRSPFREPIRAATKSKLKPPNPYRIE